MKKSTFFATLFLILSLFGFGQRIQTNVYHFGDSDKTSFWKYDIGYNHILNKNLMLGAKFGTHETTEDNDNIVLNYFGLNYQIKDSVGFLKSNFNFDYVFGDGSSLLKYDVLMTVRPSNHMYFEFNGSKDYIGTLYSIKNNLCFFDNSLSMDYSFLSNRLTFVGAYVYQIITDKNTRGIKTFKIVGYPTKNLGLILTSKISDMDFTSEHYFSPINYDIYSGTIFYKFLINGDDFIMIPRISYGKQFLDNQEKDYYSFEFVFRGWSKDMYGIDINMNYSNSKENPIVSNNTDKYNFFICNVKLIYQIPVSSD